MSIGVEETKERAMPDGEKERIVVPQKDRVQEFEVESAEKVHYQKAGEYFQKVRDEFLEARVRPDDVLIVSANSYRVLGLLRYLPGKGLVQHLRVW